MRVLYLLAALLFGLPSFAASRCDVNVPTQTVDLAQVSIAYQSIGRASDPALLLVMGLGGQLIHWPDEVVVALCQQGFRVIRYDNRGAGASSVPKKASSYAMPYFADDFAAVIDEVCPRCGRREGEGVPLERLLELKKRYHDVPDYSHLIR